MSRSRAGGMLSSLKLTCYSRRGRGKSLNLSMLLGTKTNSHWCSVPAVAPVSRGAESQAQDQAGQGELRKSRYTLDQPQMHAMYRGKFNVVDLFNKASGQPGTLRDTWRTKKVHKRLFAASISWIETNASLAFAKYNPTVTLTKREWYETLSEACLNNPSRLAGQGQCPPPWA